MYKILDILSWILYATPMKTIIFMGDSRERLREFPEEARQATGRQLLRVQNDLDPQDWKPMKTVGAGVREVRVHTGGEFRAFYVAHIGNALYVLHAFQKKTQKTSQKDIDLGRQRFKQIGGRGIPPSVRCRPVTGVD
jgi:phage-related protein